MQFEVNGQAYFLAMLPPDGDLGLFAPTRQGLRRLPIVDDDGLPFAGVMIAQTDDEPTVIN